MGDARVAATPKTVEGLRRLGYDVSIETGAGRKASFEDSAYADAGATIVDDPWGADIVLAAIGAANSNGGAPRREGARLYV